MSLQILPPYGHHYKIKSKPTCREPLRDILRVLCGQEYAHTHTQPYSAKKKKAKKEQILFWYELVTIIHLSILLDTMHP